MVLGVGDVVSPCGVAFADGQVGHEVVGGGTVPVPFPCGHENAFAGPDGDDRLAAATGPSFALGDVERLGHSVAVPGGARSRAEAYKGNVER